jgi:probable FeS assembly SUF system protein SufT
MDRREPVALRRAVEATQIPSGFKVSLGEGAWVTVHQVLGGNVTVMTERGGLARLAAEDADALGEEVAAEVRRAVEAGKARRLAAGGGSVVTEEQVLDALRTVYDPEIPANIVELGLVYLAAVEPVPEGGWRATVRMTLTAPGCGVGPMILEDARSRVAAIPGVVQTDVDLVFEPPWDPSRMSEAAKLQLGFM